MDWKIWNRAWRTITVSRGVIVALALVSVSTAMGTEMADLSVRDWLVAGDGKLTYDRSTGLEWLDLTATLDHSIVDAEALPFFDASGADGKFRWATESEIANLLTAPGIPFSDFETYYSTNVAEASALIDLLGGVPYDGDSAIKAAGISRENEPSPGAYAVSHVLVYVNSSEAQIVHPIPPLACCTTDSDDKPDVGAWLVRSTTSVLNPSIDIKPGSFPNCFNVDGNGVIPVAILGSADFDVSQIDTDSLEFAGLAVRVRGNDARQCGVEDVSGDFTSPGGAPDGFPDLVCQFVDDSEAWVPNNDSTATLTGNLKEEFSGTPFLGTESICIVP